MVDDEPDLRFLLRRIFSRAGHEVGEAGDGAAALASVHAAPPDLVVTDMMMPVMDGAELAAAIRSDDRHHRTPIIMMTSLPTALPRPQGLFDAVLRKPFTPDLLLQTMENCLAGADDVVAE